MNNLQFIKWSLEVCNQEKYKAPKELIKNYNIEILGC
jgi:hypothetical protein